MKITLKSFGGIAPKMSEHILPDNMAQVAENVRLMGGELQAWDNSVVGSALVNTGVIRTIYLFNGLYWFEFEADVDVVPGPVSGDTTSRTYYTGVAGGPRVTNTTLATGGASGAYPRDSYLLGIPAPTNAPTATPGSGGSGDSRYVAYVYTYVSGWGEEGPPSEASTPVLAMDGQTVALTNLATGPVGDYNITTKRVYRVLSGEESADYRYVMDVAIASTSADDTTEDLDLGDAISTTTFEPPSANMVGLTALPNGVFAGYYGKDIFFSEPFYPYAWPSDYSLTLPYTIMGIGFVGQNIVVATTSHPYVLTGTDPASYSQTKMADIAPCVSKRSVVSGDFGVAWATPDGLYVTDGASGRLITKDILDSATWYSAYHPTSMTGKVYQGKYWGFYETGVVGGYPVGGAVVIDLMKNPPEMTTYDTYYPAVYIYPSTDVMYFVTRDEGVNYINTFEGTTLNKVGTYTWRSKRFFTPAALSFSWARITGDWKDLDDYWEYVADRNAIIAENAVRIANNIVRGEIGGGDIGQFDVNGDNLLDVPDEVSYTGDYELTFRIIDEAGGTQEERAVYTSAPFRLEGGFRSRFHTIEVEGNIDIQQIDLATQSAELAQG